MLKKLYKLIPIGIISLICSSISIILDGVIYVRMMNLLDYGLSGEMDKLKSGIPIIIIMAFALIPIGILDSIVKGLYKKKGNLLIKNYYVTKIFNKNISEFQKENNAKYISSLTNDCNVLESNLIDAIYIVGTSMINFLVGVWILSTVNIWLVILFLVIGGINIIVSKISSKPLQKVTKERSDLFDGYTSYIKEVLSAFHIVKNNNLQDKIISSYHTKSEDIQHKGYVIEKIMSFVMSIQQFFMGSTYFGVVCVMGYFAIIGKITAASMLIITEGMQRITRPLFQITENVPKLLSTKSLIHKIENTLKDEKNEIETFDIAAFHDKIELRDVSFHYADEDVNNLILSGVDLELKKNGKYLIIGPSGGGKSTLLKLLRKYFNPTHGGIFIDGVNLKDIIKEQYFSLMANVEQQVFIFEDTLLNNITLYKEYPIEEVWSALKAAGLIDFVNSLDNGLNTIIYDNGKNISGGERSRVVIARAMLAKANILFMDEAFASLDMEKAKEIEKTILSLKDITVINVSHVIFNDTKLSYDRIIHVKGTVY
jgi:ATP-binding cassette subfamily B protein